ncbi:Tyrosine recombinase XerC [subsurface metagenome]
MSENILIHAGLAVIKLTGTLFGTRSIPNRIYATMILKDRQCSLILKELCHHQNTEKQSRLAIRNMTMASLMLYAGLRTTEVVNLIVSDLINADKPVGTLSIIRGIPRGHKGRLVDVSDILLYYLDKMNEWWWRPDAGKIGNFAFYNREPLKHITATQFRRIIRQAGINALGYSIKPNILRRTCAARLLQKTDRQMVQHLLDYRTDQDSFFYR